MTLVIPDGFAQIVHKFALSSDPEDMLVTYGINLALRGTEEPTAASDEADRWQAAWPAAGMSDEWTYRGCRAYIGQASGPPAIVDAPRSMVGTQSMATPPQNCCILVKKQSGVGGRANRGRMYLPPFGLIEANVAPNGMLVADFVEDVQLLMDALNTDFGIVILHDSTTPGALAPTNVTSLVVDNRIATQRRRLR